MNRDLSNFDYQPADKLGKLLRGRKDTFAPAVSALRGASAPVARAVPTPMLASSSRRLLHVIKCVNFIVLVISQRLLLLGQLKKQGLGTYLYLH